MKVQDCVTVIETQMEMPGQGRHDRMGPDGSDIYFLKFWVLAFFPCGPRGEAGVSGGPVHGPPFAFKGCFCVRWSSVWTTWHGGGNMIVIDAAL